jgi:hypothetical protein
MIKLTGVKMITKNQFLRYENVRKSGVTNMFAIKTVCQLSGLDRSQVLEIMDKYGELKKAYVAEIK